MKKIVLLIVIVFYNFTPLLAQKGELDLPEVNVWGKDKSVLPGLSNKDLKASPYLNKNLYLNIPDVKVPDKSSRASYYRWHEGFDFTAGWGDYGEYILSLTQGLHWAGGGFLNYSASGINKNPLMEEDEYSNLFKGNINLGKDKNNYGYSTYIKAYQNDINTVKNAFSASGNIYAAYSNLRADITAGGAYLNSKTANLKSKEAEINLKVPFYNYHHIQTEFAFQNFKSEDEKDNYISATIKYLNEVYRDIAYSIGAGYDGGELTYSLMGSAVFNGYGFYGSFNKERIIKDFYSLLTLYPYLELNGTYEYPVKTGGSFEVRKAVFKNLNAGIKLNLSRLNNYIYLFQSNSGLYNITNTAGDIGLTELDFFLRNSFFDTGFIYRTSDEKLPNIYNEIYFDLQRTFMTDFKINLGLNYAGKYKKWQDPAGNSEEKINSYINLDAMLTYYIDKNLELTAGAENILGENISRPAQYSEDDIKYFLMLNFGIKK